MDKNKMEGLFDDIPAMTSEEEREVIKRLSKCKLTHKKKCCKCKETATWCDCDETHLQHYYCDSHVPEITDDFLHNIDGFIKESRVPLIDVRYFVSDNLHRFNILETEIAYNKLLRLYSKTQNIVYKRVAECIVNYPDFIAKFYDLINYIKNETPKIDINVIKKSLKSLIYYYGEETDFRNIFTEAGKRRDK